MIKNALVGTFIAAASAAAGWQGLGALGNYAERQVEHAVKLDFASMKEMPPLPGPNNIRDIIGIGFAATGAVGAVGAAGKRGFKLGVLGL